MSSEIRTIAELTEEAGVTDTDRGEPTVVLTTYKDTGCHKCEGDGCNKCAEPMTWAQLIAPLSPEEFEAAKKDRSGLIAKALEEGRVEAERERIAMAAAARSAYGDVRAYLRGHLA